MPHDALSRIRARGHIGVRLGLARMRALLAELGDPQSALRGVHVAGTNGKGSVAAMVAAMVTAAGLRASQAPSPHLASYRERIVVDGQLIAMDDLDALLEEVLLASEPGEREHGPTTEFELLMAAAFLWSARRHVDVAIIEVGLGGRLDATNTWDAEVAAITNVGLDHEAFLGRTVEVVAAEKAAIVKAGSRAVTGATGIALDVIMRRAEEVGASLRVCQPLPIERSDRDGIVLRHPSLGPLRVPLLGRHQAHNAAVALGAVQALSDAGVATIDDEAIRRGIAATRWPGRLELLDADGLVVLLDGAHNPDGAATLAATVDELAAGGILPAARSTLLVGVMADKVIARVLSALAASELLRQSRVIAVTVPDTDRSLAAVELAAAWEAIPGRGSPAVAADDIDEALAQASQLARRDGGALIVAGSLYLVGAVRTRLVGDREAG